MGVPSGWKAIANDPVCAEVSARRRSTVGGAARDSPAPCFMVGPDGYIALEAHYPRKQKISLLRACRDFYRRMTAYDGRGLKRRSAGIAAARERTWWRLLIEHTFHDPWADIELQWSEPLPYEIGELKRAFIDTVDSGGESLTGGVDPRELKTRIEGARTFEDLVATYRWSQGGEEPELPA